MSIHEFGASPVLLGYLLLAASGSVATATLRNR
jgi:hypothetical protein